MQVHVSQSSTVADHCRSYALSYPKEPSFQATCDHDHSDVCERCATLASTLNDIEEGLVAQSQNMTSNTKEELVFRVKNAKTAILAWKSHLLRSVNQDGARVQLLEEIDESSVLIVQDWAMKYLPRKYRESQTDWFGKRGIPWHLTVATRREGGQLQMLTFAHIFKSCTQDSCAVLAVMADVIRQLKIAMPGLKTVCYRQDNAGCYHCGTTLICAAALGHEEGVKIRRLDFSDPQGGKAACDRKAATIKSHMRIYLNAGNDIETPEQMRDAILSSGGVPGVNVALCETVQVPKVLSSKIDGISQLSNVEYKEEGLLVWRAYGIGDGKLIPTDKLHCPSPSDLPTLTGVTRSYSGAFTSVKERRIKASVRDPDPPVNIEEEDSNAAIFSCPEEGCVKTFVRYSSMQRHLDCGKHQRALERSTLLDKAAVGYAQRLEGQCEAVPELEAVAEPPSSHDVLPKGWALKSSASRRSRFTYKQKNYLTEKFQQGERSGRKSDPASVARSMMSAVDSQGKRMFSSEEFLTASQVAGFFSRLAAKKSLFNDDDLEEEIECATQEATIEELTNNVSRELFPGHPIMWDKYNLCEMTSGGKLNTTKLSVAKLREICAGLDIAVDVSSKRKQPYADKIEEYCQTCRCKADK